MKSPIKHILFLVSFALATLCEAQPDSWTTSVVFGGGERSGAVSFTIGDTAYAGTGFNGTYLNDFWKRDPATGIWLPMEPLSVIGREGAVAFSVNGKGYVGTGRYSDPSLALADFHEYDPSTGQWTPIADCPLGGGVKYATAFSIDGKGYVTTGIASGTIDKLTELVEFDPVTGLWNSAKPPLGGFARASACSFVLGNKAYVFGGASDNLGMLNELWSFDETNGWVSRSSLIGQPGRGVAMAFGIGNTGFIVGGVTNGNTPLNELWQYNPTMDAWTARAPMNGGARYYGTAFTLGQTAYVGTGYVGGNRVASFEEYTTPPVTCVAGTPCDLDPCLIGETLDANCVCAGGVPDLTDDDLDGTPDCSDSCLNTPLGEGVNASGCSCSQVVVDDGDSCTEDICINGEVQHSPLDTDGDGIEDCSDSCPFLYGQNGDACGGGPCLSNGTIVNCACNALPINQPPGDTYATAIPISLDNTGNATLNGTNMPCFTSTYTLALAQATPDVWYSVSTGACASGDMVIATVSPGTLDDTYLHLLDATGTTALAHDDDTGPGFLSLISYPITANTTYIIVVEGYGSNTGTFTLAVTVPGAVDSDGDGVRNCADNCPNVAGVVGSTCDDNDSNTTNDVLGTDCVCAGTSVCIPPGGLTVDVGYWNGSCVQPVTLSAILEEGSAPYTYSWTGTGTFTGFDEYTASVIPVEGDNLWTVIVTNACGSDTAQNAEFLFPIIYAATVTNESCAGAADGQVELHMHGFTTAHPASFTWQSPNTCITSGGCPVAFPACTDGYCTSTAQNVSGLAPGTYTVTATSADCFTTRTYTIGTSTLDTDGDGVLDCQDNCPNVSGQIGSSCTDNNANTIGDILNANCVCVGTPTSPEIDVTQPAGTSVGGVRLVAWGYNNAGQSTVPLIAQSGVAAIDAGHSFAMALKSDGSVIAWGSNASGQTTVPITALSGVTAIATGYYHSVALKNDGSVIAWGDDLWGQATVPVGALNGVIAIAAGYGHTVALKSDGSVVAWGLNDNGQASVPPSALSGVIAITAGHSHTVALKSDGSVVAWGLNEDNQATPPVAAQSGVIAIAAGLDHTAALKNDGSIIVWGIDDGDLSMVPAEAQSNVTALASGEGHLIVLKSDGSVVTWGHDYGATPGEAQSGVTAISGGVGFTMALRNAILPVGFGNQTVSTTSAAKTFTITNTGNADLNGLAIFKSGANFDDFTVNTSSMLTSVTPGGSTTFTVTFTPAATGARAATLHIASNDNNENPYNIELTGNGLPLDTDGDGIPDATDSCPYMPGHIGSPCTISGLPGIIDATCQCALLSNCTENVTVELRSDALSSQASWQILAENTSTVLCQFSVPMNNITSPITENCCLPAGCYRLRVSDSGGDGFVSGGITGGYQMRERYGAQRRIIDNFGNFTALPGGPPDVSALSGSLDNGAFCLPLGNVQPVFTSCDKLDWVNHQFIVATENTAVSAQWDVTPPIVQPANSGYEFWFFDANGGYSYRRFRSHSTTDGTGTGATRACHLKINKNVPLPPGNQNTNVEIPYNQLLNVRIRGRVNGVNQPFGPACLFKLDASAATCPRTKLQDNPSNTADFSCGVNRVFGGANSNANKLVANPPQFAPAVPSGNVRFQYRFRLPGEVPVGGGAGPSCIVRPPQTSATLYLNWTTGEKLKCNTQYEVDVRVSKDLGATWCIGGATNNPAHCATTVSPWGKVCMVNVTTSTYCPPPSPLLGGASNLMVQSSDLTMYPNPNRGDQLFLELTNVSADVGTATIDIFSLAGQRVSTRVVPVQDGLLKTVLDLQGSLASGLYMVQLTAGTRVFNERLVIQP